MDNGPIVGGQIPALLHTYATASLQNIQRDPGVPSESLPQPYSHPPHFQQAIPAEQSQQYYAAPYLPASHLRPIHQPAPHAIAALAPHQLHVHQYEADRASQRGLEPVISLGGVRPAKQDGILDQDTRLQPGFVGDSELADVSSSANPSPPNLEDWRRRLFDVDGIIVLTEDEYATYWPHVDNVYSHRSTQKYKRNPFIAHYWDCRLKGRPSGTKKTEDPSKKKRKRIARERDLCEVKIKVTEYFPRAVNSLGVAVINVDGNDGSQAPDVAHSRYLDAGSIEAAAVAAPSQPDSDSRLHLPLFSAGGVSVPLASASGSRIYTIQRVNGNVGNGKNEVLPQRHRHSLEYSDAIKKNSVVRQQVKGTKPHRKKIEKSYHTKATGNALQSAKKHSKDAHIKLFGSCFCPFVQRVWISLEHKQIPYQYIEIDPYEKPKELLDINPRGLVPALKDGDWGCYESTVLMEYLEDLQQGQPLLPSDPKARAHSRLWSDHANRSIIPTFYRYLQAQEQDKQIGEAKHLQEQIRLLVEAADPTGPYFLGENSSFVDFQIAPWVLRFKRVLTPYRGWPAPEAGSRWEKWVNAIETDKDVQATTSDDKLYIDSYLRYAENRPNTSQVARAINEGRGLP